MNIELTYDKQGMNNSTEKQLNVYFTGRNDATC